MGRGMLAAGVVAWVVVRGRECLRDDKGVVGEGIVWLGLFA